MLSATDDCAACEGTVISKMHNAQVLDIKTESAEVLESLAALSALHEETSASSRRQLKTHVEERGIDNLEQFLLAAQGVIRVRAN